MRRRAWKDQAPPPAADVDLTTLCIVQGCIRPRVGANLCRWHDNESDPD